MNPFLENTPTVKKLWEFEKSRYRQWIILFGVALLVIFSLLMASFIAAWTNLNGLSGIVQQELKNPDSTNVTLEYATSFVRTNYIILPAIEAALMLIAIVLYVKTIWESYHNHNFSKLSTFSLLLVEITGFISIVGIFRQFSNYSLLNQSSVFLFQFINWFIVIAGAFFALKIGAIKRRFQISERVEVLKKNPDFMNMANNPQNMQNPFFGGFNSTHNSFKGQNQNAAASNASTTTNKTSNNSTSNQTNTVSRTLTKREKAIKDLESLSFKQLQEMAQKLMISGWQKMEQKQLLETLKRLTVED